MSVYPSREEIIRSCPALGSLNPDEAIPVVADEYDSTIGKSQCKIPIDLIVAACVFGCRGVTAVSSTGCPLRDGPAKVSLPKIGT